MLDMEHFSIIWVFVTFLMLPSRVPTYQSEKRNQHVFLFLLLLLLFQTVGLQIITLSSSSVPRFARCVSSIAYNLIG